MKYDYDEQIIQLKLRTIQTPEFDISGEVNKKLKHKGYVKNSKKSLRLAIVISLCLILSTGVLAVTISNFNNILSKVDPEIAPMLQPIEMTSEDNGIKMEVVAAYNDDEMAVIYITLQDLVKDRLDKSVSIFNYSLSEGALFNSQIIDYDEVTKTATFRIQANGGEKMNGKELVFSIKSFLSNAFVFEQVETGIDLVEVKKNNVETIPLNMEHVSGGSNTMFDEWKEQGVIQVLKADQRNIKLPDIEFMYISNIGYIDDKLHILTHWVGEGIDDHGYFYFTDTEDNKLEIYPSTVHFGIDELGNTKDRGDYIEYVFDLEGIDPEEVSLKGYFVSSGTYIEGDWKVKFKLQSINLDREAKCDLDFGTWQLNRIYVSKIGVTLLGTGEYDVNQTPEVIMNMSDGTVNEISYVSSFNNDEKIYIKALTDFPIDSSLVESISINGEAIKLD
ncbi:DUF4179 domain-containing protein [Tissierella sp. Yu-01]|uniref:DUF4179 domain-containing protein n=1 Tax=Tissierella sp. Yu-01 TaxID=3035694 RepID=UPI00240E04D8|nr:DUF4179 domain-containing protein [Tissierella sp. Yu-01]WFA08802.1 DUF4179 domain-containing protein [Tissierella sp. Yu-01]